MASFDYGLTYQYHSISLEVGVLLKKKIRFVLCASAFVLAFWFLWNNMLMFDDYHPAYEASLETVIIPPKQDNPEYGTSDTQTKAVPVMGYHIHINLGKHTMYVYKDGQLLKTYPVSGGRKSSPSPTGTWTVISKDSWDEGFGGAWLGLDVPSEKCGIHGTIFSWSIGKSNKTKGCIRMKNRDVKELYDMVPHGTTVTIVYDNENINAGSNQQK